MTALKIRIVLKSLNGDIATSDVDVSDFLLNAGIVEYEGRYFVFDTNGRKSIGFHTFVETTKFVLHSGEVRKL